MIWKWKRPAAFLLVAAMIFTMPGVPASAVEPDVSGASGSAPAECSCETHCEQGAVNPDCPVCAAEDADLSACKGTEQATPLMAAAASTEETISGEVTWNNRTITTPVRLTGDTTITLSGENSITISEPDTFAALDMNYCSLTIQGSGSLTVTVPKKTHGIVDVNYSERAGGTLTIKGANVTTDTNGFSDGLYAKSIVIESGELNLDSITTASLTMKGGALYATGTYGAIFNRKGTARNIDSSLSILYSDQVNAEIKDMQDGTEADTIRNMDVKTIYIAKLPPRARLTAGAQQGTLREGLNGQTATITVTGSKVQMGTLNVEWEGEHTGLTAEKSSDNQTITVTGDNNIKAGRYKLKLTADGVEGTNPNKATAIATVTVAAAPVAPTVTAPTANALTYNGSEQALVTAGKTTGGTMLYRLDDSKWSEQIPTAKNAGEYTVWYKVQGNAEYADVAEQSLTVTVSNQPSGGGGASGGGGGGAAPAPTPADSDVITVKEDTKDNTTSKPGAETDTTTTTKTTVKNTTTEMTKNEQGQDVSKTTASVSKDLGDKLLDQAVSNKSDTIEITVKSSDANNGSGAGSTGAADSVKETEVELPKATVNAIAKDTNADLVIKTDNGEVVLDNKTLETIAGAANGDTVTIVVGENTQLKETQKPAEKIVGKNGTLFDLVAKIGEKHLHQFEGGKAYVTLPMPNKLKGKDILVIYIDDNGLCRILNHSVEKIGAEDYIRFTTTRFSTFAVVDKDEAERLIKEQNAAHVKELMQSAKFKVTTTKTSKKSVKVQVAAKSSKTMISDIKSLGYTVKYQFYRSTKKDAGYKLRKTSSKNSFISTKGTKGRKYYYKARVLVYDGSELVAKSALKQCSYGARR